MKILQDIYQKLDDMEKLAGRTKKRPKKMDFSLKDDDLASVSTTPPNKTKQNKKLNKNILLQGELRNWITKQQATEVYPSSKTVNSWFSNFLASKKDKFRDQDRSAIFDANQEQVGISLFLESVPNRTKFCYYY